MPTGIRQGRWSQSSAFVAPLTPGFVEERLKQRSIQGQRGEMVFHHATRSISTFLGTTRDSSSRPTNGKTTRAHNMSSLIVSETGTRASEVFVERRRTRLIIDIQEQPRVASREPAWMEFEVAISRAAWGAATGNSRRDFQVSRQCGARREQTSSHNSACHITSCPHGCRRGIDLSLPREEG
jgi:hypothetical protein